jgi:chemotaxis-related protein WspB
MLREVYKPASLFLNYRVGLPRLRNMLYLLFQLGKDRYGLRTDIVVEIIPLVNHKAIPQAPTEILGLINYRGTPLPVIDLTQLATGQRSRQSISTRIIVVNYTNKLFDHHLLGLLTEKVTTTMHLSETEFKDSGINMKAVPYLKEIAPVGEEIIQRVEVQQLLSEEIKSLLFQ